ncbi:hypothetical protein B296_00026406 [Ensete ventricosum]|uniref:Thioesterase domain-containing protein n=1 Tax=Ensete ventricosum TaxID=4639 RepID=A0A427A601_ENSVE|nr:hypothetical protein B296_00026406 [Ensete ventricosum]
MANSLHGGATASLVDLVGSAAFYTAGAQSRGVPMEIGISYLDAAFANFGVEISFYSRIVLCLCCSMCSTVNLCEKATV